MFVSDEESNHGMIDFEQAFDLTEHSPRNTALSMLMLAGFDDLSGVTDDEAYWFCSIICYVINEYDSEKIKPKYRLTNKVSFAQITLGVDGGIRAKSLIRNQSASLSYIKASIGKKISTEERNIRALNKIFQDKLNRRPEKKTI